MMFIPTIKMIQNSQNPQMIRDIVTTFSIKEKMSDIDILTMNWGLYLLKDNEIVFKEVLSEYLKRLSKPKLHYVFEPLTQFMSGLTIIEGYYNSVQMMIEHSLKTNYKQNIQMIELFIMKLYKTNNPISRILGISLYADLGQKLADVKYFDRLRDFIELEVAICQIGDLEQLLRVLSVVKRLSLN